MTISNNSLKPLKTPRARLVYGVEGYIYTIWQVKQLQYYKIPNPTWRQYKQIDRQQRQTKEYIGKSKKYLR